MSEKIADLPVNEENLDANLPDYDAVSEELGYQPDDLFDEELVLEGKEEEAEMDIDVIEVLEDEEGDAEPDEEELENEVEEA